MSRRNPQHIRRVSHSRRLLCIAALILYRHFCRMVVKTYRLFLAGLEGLEPSTYGLRTTFRIRTETIIFIISKWPLCVVCHFLIDTLQLSVHCSAIELQTHIVVSINYTSEIRNSLEIMKLFLHLFLFISRFYILYSKNHKKFNFLEYFFRKWRRKMLNSLGIFIPSLHHSLYIILREMNFVYYLSTKKTQK